MLRKLNENRDCIIFLIISAVLLSICFYFCVTIYKVEVVKIEPLKTGEEDVVYNDIDEISSFVTESSSETTTISTTESTTLVQIDDTPGFIEVPNLVPVGEDLENIEFTTEERSEVSTEGICTFSVSCNTILNNMNKLDKAKASLIPDDGMIYKTAHVGIRKGDTVFSLLERELVLNSIHFEYNKTTNVYIEGINNIYEFDCGDLSGWLYKVNGEIISIGCDQYVLQDGDVVEWVYTCDLGKDVGTSLTESEVSESTSTQVSSELTTN